MLIHKKPTQNDAKKLSLEHLYTAYRNAMYWAAFNILHHEQDAEDAVHQAFLSIHKHLDKLGTSSPESLCAFVVTVAQNKAIDMLRLRSKRSECPLDTDILIKAEDSFPTFSSPLAKLEPRYRQVLMLRYLYGYSVKESAQIMNLSSPALRKLTERAKNQLRNILNEKEGSL